jgi:hypothetical protein
VKRVRKLQGFAVRNELIHPKKFLRLVSGAVLAFALIAGSAAMAADDDDDESFEEKFMKSLLGNDKPVIDYRERSPLVVPPSATLPPPEAEKTIADPSWPKDADVQRIKKAKRVDPRDKPRGGDDRMLSPQELARGRGAAGSGGVGATSSRSNTDGASGGALTQGQLGAKKNVFQSIFSSSANETETGVFTGEPARTTLTDPPKGYMTPSPNYPYGISPTKEVPRSAKIEDRPLGKD